MIDKGKYASHGVYIKKISENHLGRWSKPKSAVINPVPSAVPREKTPSQQHHNMDVKSRTFNAKFKFQEGLDQKPLPQDLIQPFLYIEKVLKKKKILTDSETGKNVAKPPSKNANKEKQQAEGANKTVNKQKPKVVPFVTSTVISKARPASASTTPMPQGYANLFQFETDKRDTANLLFSKMLQAGIENVKQSFHIWNPDSKKPTSGDINISEEQFIEFVRSMVPNRLSRKNIAHFFALYKNKLTPEISVNAFAYNYGKYKKAQTQITNIMSEKAAKDRYNFLKSYLSNYLSYYAELKVGMKGMKQYEESMRKHFRRLYQSYRNPFEEQIAVLKAELQQPIIKYDTEKKERNEKKIAEYEAENAKIYEKLSEDYSNFMQVYEQAIVKNHDLFFTKRTVAHLLMPIIQSEPYLTKQLLEQQVEIRQAQKQRYLETLSDIVVELDSDKKNLREDNFSLEEIVNIVTMKFRNKRNKEDQQREAFTVDSLKKLIKQIKRQFLTKFNLVSQDPENFPADQQIPNQILHTCFEMQCTKVLFKNRIWSELVDMIPNREIESRLHQKTIDANICMQYLKRYFVKLDQRSSIEMNKAKQVSLLVENAYNQNFGRYAEVMWKVIRNVDNYVEGQDEEEELRQLEQKKKKKVGFADVVDSKLAVDRGEKSLLPDPENEEADNLVKALVKLINQGAKGTETITSKSLARVEKEPESPQIQQSPSYVYQNLQMLKTMARSYFEPEAMNTNAFDIRFYQKIAEEEKRSRMPEEQLIELGTSMLLSGAPKPQDIEGGDDPLRISRFLLKNIDTSVKQQQKIVHHKQYERDIREGVDQNYFRQKIKLQNRPTRFDSQGKSKYSVLLPVGYYESYIVGQSVPDQEKWYLRPHHVETLTQNPLSKKDNIINTEYQSKLEKLQLKKRPDQFVIEQNVQRKQSLISELQQRIMFLKNQVGNAKRKSSGQGHKIHPSIVNQYYQKITQGKQDKQLELAAYQGVLYDLRKRERQLLNNYRGKEFSERGEPNDKWWERKDKQFNRELRKDRQLVADSTGQHRGYVQKLKNNEVY